MTILQMKTLINPKYKLNHWNKYVDNYYGKSLFKFINLHFFVHQRKQEYAEARLRIMGEELEEDLNADDEG